MIDLNGVAPMGYPTKSPPEEIREQVERLRCWLAEQRGAKLGTAYVACSRPAVSDADEWGTLEWVDARKLEPEPTETEQAAHHAMMRGR